MEPSPTTAERRVRWKTRARPGVIGETPVGTRPSRPVGPREVLDTHVDERGTLHGPYDYCYRIDAGYCEDRTVIRP